MKGFGIEIKNDLLEPKHVENMGTAVWLYMWLVDKMTSVTEEGIGKVLGGKPIKYEEVKLDLGISRNTYTRWIDKLMEYPYIETTVAPYGIVFRVLKAHKHFGKRYARNGEPTSRKMVNHSGFSPENGEPNKTVSVRDKTRNRDFLKNGEGGEELKALPKEEFLKRLSQKIAAKK